MKSALDQLRSKYPDLPREYFDLLERTGRSEGELSVEPGWYQMWSAEEALVALRLYPELYFFACGRRR